MKYVVYYADRFGKFSKADYLFDSWSEAFEYSQICLRWSDSSFVETV